MYRTIFDEKRKQWCGQQSCPIYNPNVSLGEVLLRSMEINGPRIAQVSDDSGAQMTFSEIRRKTIQAAISLQGRGYEAGAVFSFMTRNSENLAPLVLAAFCIGCPMNGLDTSLGENEIKHLLNVVKPNVMFCDVDMHDILSKYMDELEIVAKIITIDGKVESSECADDLFVESDLEPYYIPAAIDGVNHIAFLLTSSGTTGLPKGVCISHSAALEPLSHSKSIQCDDVLLCFSQISWIIAFHTLIRGTLFGATRIITTEVFRPELAFRLIPQYKVSFIMSPTHQMVSMLRHPFVENVDFTSLRNYFVTGSKVPINLATKFNKYFPKGNIINLIQ